MVILFAMVINLAFSANVTNVRKLMAPPVDRSFITSETCKGVCTAQTFCGMPAELAQVFIQSQKKEGQQQQQRPQRPFPGMFPGYGMFPGMYGMFPRYGMPYYGEEAAEGGARRLLADKSTCKNKPQLFQKKCNEMKTCGKKALQGYPKDCDQAKERGMCLSHPTKMEALCPKSCGVCKNAGASAVCDVITAAQCLSDAIKVAPECANTCWKVHGIRDGCRSTNFPREFQRACRTSWNPFKLCGAGSPGGAHIKDCKTAAKALWCTQRSKKAWMSKICPMSCKSCETCAEYSCPENFVRRQSNLASKDVSDATCCIAKEKVCSCEWSCMFTDNCCEDFSELCCK